MLACWLGAADAAPAQANPPPAGVNLLNNPMVFYLAKGGADACGPGCSEWIAGEGQFDAGAARRLGALLARQRGKTLPIYFESPGGLSSQGMEIGRLLRERGMTAGVGRTVPDGCAGADEKACKALKQSGRLLPAELNNLATCSSACVSALIGGKVRHVPPGARVGVHSGKLVLIERASGRAVGPSRGSSAARQLAARGVVSRDYLRTMGIDARLLELVEKTPHEQIYWLRRDEIAGLGIDPREFVETPWLVPESRSPTLRKFLVEARGPANNEFRLAIVNVTCIGRDRVNIGYMRSLSSDDSAMKQTLSFVANDRSISLRGPTPVPQMSIFDPGSSFDGWGATVSFDRLGGVSQDGAEIVISNAAGTAEYRRTRLSTAGLSEAIDALRRKCNER